MGEVGAFAQRIVRGGNVLTLDEAWREWCDFVQAPDDSTEAGGIKRLRFSSTLRDYVTGLPAAKLVSVDGKKIRGWRSWRLISPEEAEHAAAPKQAEETDSPYELGPEAEQAVQDLMARFPDDFAVFGAALGRGVLFGCLLGVRDDSRLVALRDRYENGRKLAEKLQGMAERISDHGREKEPVISDEAVSLAGGWLDTTVTVLAWLAEEDRSLGPLYKQARDRHDSLGMTVSERKTIALSSLYEADRQSGGFETDAETLVQDAVELLVAKLNRMPPDEAARYNAADIEAAIKELVGLEDQASAAGHQGWKK